MNTLCLAALNRQPGEGAADNETRGIPVQQIRELVDGSLVGVLLFGSAARANDARTPTSTC